MGTSFGSFYGLSVLLSSFLTSVQSKPSLGDLSFNIVGFGWAFLGEACSADEIDGEVDFDSLLFGFSEDLIDNLVACFIKE
jgi:hypothetical protein